MKKSSVDRIRESFPTSFGPKESKENSMISMKVCKVESWKELYKSWGKWELSPSYETEKDVVL